MKSLHKNTQINLNENLKQKHILNWYVKTKFYDLKTLALVSLIDFLFVKMSVF